MTERTLDTRRLLAEVEALPEDGLSEIRRSAVAGFVQDGFPTVRHEDWKYTSLDSVVELSNAWLEQKPASLPADQLSPAAEANLQRLRDEIDAHWLVIRGGLLLDTFGDGVPAEDSGWSLQPLATNPPKDGLWLDDGVARFNAALLRDGYQVSVKAGSKPDKPLALLVLSSSDDMPNVSPLRIIVDIEDNAHCRMIQAHWSADGKPAFATAVTEVELARGANFSLLQLQETGNEHALISTVVATQHADSVFNHNSFDLGGSLVRNDVKIDIAEAGADCSMHGLYLARDGQHIDNHTRVDHRVGPATSNELYRGILGHGSRCVFNGKAVVHEGADGTDANQANHNLLLSGHAEIDTKPELEIYADDVKCSHGATVGQLDKTAIYYLRTRGLSKADATALLTRSFAASVLSGLAIEECREYLSQRINERLDELVGENEQ